MKKMRSNSLLLISTIGLLLSCSTLPKGLTPVQNFDQGKYLGQWYEIARMDFRFERYLNQVTATYSLNPDGSIKVLNRGFSTKDLKWKQAQGKARFVKTPDVGMLKVSFFGPFYSGYNVVAVDNDYQYALVVGKTPEYVWILSRDTKVPEEVKNKYLRLAEELGCKTEELIWTEHPLNQ